METVLRDRLHKVLMQLDVDNNEHWTQERVPAMAAVHEIAGDEDFTRALVIEAAPLFTRDNRTFILPPEREETNDQERSQASQEGGETGSENREASGEVGAQSSTTSESPNTDEGAKEAHATSRADSTGSPVPDEPDQGEQKEVASTREQYTEEIALMQDQVTHLQQVEAQSRNNYLQIERACNKLIAERDQLYPVKTRSEEYQEHLARKKVHRERAAAERLNAPLVPAIPERTISALDKSLRQQGHGMGKPMYHPQGASK